MWDAPDSTPDPEATRRQARARRLGDLLVQAQAGKRECVRDIVAEATPLLWNIARAQGLSRADAEDVVQSVWLSLVSCLTTIQTPEALVGWLATAAKREAWRVRTVREHTFAVDTNQMPETADPGEAIEDRILAEERRQMVRDALTKLDSRCVELLRALSFSDQPNYATVAVALGRPVGSIGPTRGRCLDKLRTVITDNPKSNGLWP